MKIKKIKKVLIIGSGPIVIGQAAEFDYSGTQACLAAREEGVRTVLVNSNPATIQTDHEVADIVYIEPLNHFYLEKIIAKEKPDGLIATVGGQTALNLATQLSQKGILKKNKVAILGTDIESIELGEDRGKFKSLMEKIGQPVLPSMTVKNTSEALNFAKRIGFPIVLRSAYNLGGAGSSIATSINDLKNKVRIGVNSSLIKEVLIEKSVLGWAEIEYEVIRDKAKNKIIVCDMENIDPMGVHTGESMVIAPNQTLSDKDYQRLRKAAFDITEALNIRGSCNIQFALNQKTGEHFVIEVNTRLSRSSALASKATGYPIARVATKIALGINLTEIKNPASGNHAFFEPRVNYIVIKIPKWPSDKFSKMDKNVGITMKSTGETMAIGGNFEEAMFKAIESLNLKDNFYERFSKISRQSIKGLLTKPNVERLSAIFAAYRIGVSEKKISELTRINPFFIKKLKKLYLRRKFIFSKINVYKMIDTCSSELEAFTPYFYSAHGLKNEAKSLTGPKVIILGSGPIKIGQGIEFDYLTVHAVKALKEKKVKSIVINNNPETVSTDFSISDRLYFEPLTPNFILKVVENEKEGLLGVIPQFGGQTAINLVEFLERSGVPILGTSKKSIDASEDREKTAEIITSLGYKMPTWLIVQNKIELLNKVKNLGYPVLIKPSFVLAGEGMVIAKNDSDVNSYLKIIGEQAFYKPVLVDKFLEKAMEIDVDFIADGQKTVAYILEQLEPAGIHSGDSRCVFPPQNITLSVQEKIKVMVEKISEAFGIIGIANLQCAVRNNEIFILEVNPRASRTVPFLSKCLGISLAKLATNVILGDKLPENLPGQNGIVAIKTPVFSFDKLPGVSKTLGPLMKSTGETMSIGKTYQEALRKIIDKEGFNDTNVYRLT